MLDRTEKANPVAPPSSELSEYLQALRRRWKVVATVAVLIIGLSHLYLFFATRTYTATVQVLLDVPENILGDESILGKTSLDTAAIESQVVVLRSMSLLFDLVRNEGLETDPEFGSGGEEGPLAALKTRIVATVELLIGDPGQDDTTGIEDAAMDAAQNVRDAIEARQVGNAHVISVSIETESAEKSARLLNSLAKTYISRQNEGRRRRVRAAYNALRIRLISVEADLKSAETKMEDFKVKNGFIKSGGTLADQQLSELNLNLIEAQTDLAEKSAKYDQAARTAASGGDLFSIPDVASSSVLSTLRAQHNDLGRREAGLLQAGADLHPLLPGLKAERGELERQIRTEVDRLLASLKNMLEVAQAREASLSNSMRNATGQVGLETRVAVELRELERTAASYRADYESLLDRARIAAGEEAFARSDARVISPALIPKDPSSPKSKVITAFGVLLGLGLGVFAGLSTDSLDGRKPVGKGRVPSFVVRR